MNFLDDDMNPKLLICIELLTVPLATELPPEDSNVVTLLSTEDEKEPVKLFKNVLSLSIWLNSNASTLLSIEPVKVSNSGV